MSTPVKSTINKMDPIRKGTSQVTVEQIQEDRLTVLANRYWSDSALELKRPFNPKIIDDIYKKEMIATGFSTKRLVMLEFSRYLENFLWPNYSEKASDAHVLQIAAIVNEKFRERVPAWDVFVQLPHNFSHLFQHTLELVLQDEGQSLHERTLLLIFIKHLFNSLEVDLIRGHIQKLVSLSIWANVLQGKREEMFMKHPKLRKFFNLVLRNEAQLEKCDKEKAQFERNFLSHLFVQYLSILSSVPEEGIFPLSSVKLCERFLELMVDIEAQLPLRRFVNLLLDDKHIVVNSKLSALWKRSEGKLFVQLLEMLEMYAEFEIDEVLGEPLTLHDRIDLHYNRVTALQKAVFRDYDSLHKFALANVASIDTRESLIKHFETLSVEELHTILADLNYLPRLVEGESSAHSKEFLLNLIVWKHERKRSQLEVINEMPLYPTEKIIWDENIVPCEYFSGEDEIRQDIEDAVTHMKPWRAEDGHCMFGGWARMAQPIAGVNVVEVAKPRVGENHPAQVRADVSINLSVRPEVKFEWEGMRKHDVAFLLTVRPEVPIGYLYKFDEDFLPQVGLVYVRGCEVEGMLDDLGKLIEEGPEAKPDLLGDNRTYRVWLDPNQYQLDMTNTVHGAEDVYETFNVIMRRKPKENNFKAVLETIRDLMNIDCVVPDWLHDLVLGYGSPDSAHYSKMRNKMLWMDWNDTFLSIDHLKSCFPDRQGCLSIVGRHSLDPPFRLRFVGDPGECTKKRLSDDDTPKVDTVLEVEPHRIPNRGPYPYNQPKKNNIPFTPAQTEAIRSGMQPGLTMVVGPPGTGKTDVAVQIISNIYHNFPDQRTLIVTHSNQALNQLFEKIIELDIDERHLLRLGHGEEALETHKDFSRYGRVNYVLAQRMELLEEVSRLQTSLGVSGDMSYTCETAGYFFLYQVLARWEEFQSKVKAYRDKADGVRQISQLFPFGEFFDNAPQPLFKRQSFLEDMDIADGCFRHIRKIFTQLEEFRAFELLRSGSDRANYLLIKEAKVIAMTCTHAALKRRDLVDVGFQFDNILMEEAAQILEIETFIPLLLQNPEDGNNRLKRWIMIGDHHQLPPVIKNMAFQKFSNMEQSLFTRFVRLGVPTVDLDAQGRARASIASLYNWRYKRLGSLPHVITQLQFRLANTGFMFDYQLVDVGDFNGVGESVPNPFFYQNLAEAEYVVAVFMYMRLIGYPAEKISILTTYNGQKHLIRDVIVQRCADNPFIGKPYKVTTVDRYQGQQNDYILLSLVRTRTVGHLRDVRRLVVAMSRARLGLYIFARVSLFSNCFELTPAFNRLTARPTYLHLIPSEVFATDRKVNDPPAQPPMAILDMPHMAQFVYDFYEVRIHQLMRMRGFIQKSHLQQPPKQYLLSAEDTANIPSSEINTGNAELESSVDGSIPLLADSLQDHHSPRSVLEDDVADTSDSQMVCDDVTTGCKTPTSADQTRC